MTTLIHAEEVENVGLKNKRTLHIVPKSGSGFPNNRKDHLLSLAMLHHNVPVSTTASPQIYTATGCLLRRGRNANRQNDMMFPIVPPKTMIIIGIIK